MDVIQNQLNLALQQVQNISAEREVANTIGLQAQQDLVNLRLNFQEVAAEKENLNQSLQAAQVVADTVPALKTSLQKSIAASHKSQQQIAQLKSNFEASVKSLEMKEKESLLLKKEVRTANHSYRDLLAFQNDKVKEAKDSALQDFTKESEQFIPTIQTGSIQLNREFKNAYQKMVENEWSLTDLFALIQELLTIIYYQQSFSFNSFSRSDSDHLRLLKNWT